MPYQRTKFKLKKIMKSVKTLFPKFTSLLLVVALTVYATGCKKDDTTTTTVSSDDAADAVSDALTSDFSSSTSDAADASTTQAASANGRVETSTCGVLKEITKTVTNPTGSVFTYNWNADYKLTLTCNGKIPTGVTFTATVSGTSAGPRASSTSSSTSTFSLTNFDASQSAYALTGTFVRQSTINALSTSKSFSGNTTLTLTSLSIDKTTKKVTSGTGTFTITGTSSAGTTYSYTGSLTYTSSTSAVLVINGTTYTLDLTSGKVTKS